jgi:hypothetical protein
MLYILKAEAEKMPSNKSIIEKTDCLASETSDLSNSDEHSGSDLNTALDLSKQVSEHLS